MITGFLKTLDSCVGMISKNISSVPRSRLDKNMIKYIIFFLLNVDFIKLF